MIEKTTSPDPFLHMLTMLTDGPEDVAPTAGPQTAKELAQQAICGDDAIKLPDSWDTLTDAEKRAFATELERALTAEGAVQRFFGREERHWRMAHCDRIRGFLALLPADLTGEAGQ